jgi:hypothetical protein
MGTAPQTYYDFVMHYAPYFYVITTTLTQDASSGQKPVTVADGAKFQAGFPVQIYDNSNSEWNVVGSVNGNVLTMQNNLAYTYHVANGGSVDGPDPSFGQGVMAAAFAIDFLYQAYSSSQFAGNQAAILAEIQSLANFIVSQQCTNASKKAYGGFASSVGSTQYYSVDAARCIPSLLRAYALTNTASYLAAAKLAGLTFLYNMQHQPSVLGVHDKYYGGFARYVDINDNWSRYMDVEPIYGLIGLQMLAQTYDVANALTYNNIVSDAIGFLRSGFEQLYLWFDPKPSGDEKWHRVGLGETQVYDDPIGFALLGLYTYEGWSASCQKVYYFVETIKASAAYPAYNPAICWSGYIDVVSRFPACAYYDAITIGILGQIRKAHDKPAYSCAMQIISQYQPQFMYWGPQFTDYSPITVQKAMANVSWLAQFYLNYIEPVTDFTELLSLNGEDLLLYPVQQAADKITWGQPISLEGMVTMGVTTELILEPGYITEQHITVFTFYPVRVHDKIRRVGTDYEVITVSVYDLSGDPLFYKSVCRRLITQ